MRVVAVGQGAIGNRNDRWNLRSAYPTDWSRYAWPVRTPPYFYFRYNTTSQHIDFVLIWQAVLENIEISVGIFLISVLVTEICILLVWPPRCCLVPEVKICRWSNWPPTYFYFRYKATSWYIDFITIGQAVLEDRNSRRTLCSVYPAA